MCGTRAGADLQFPELGVALDPGPGWRLERSVGSAGAVLAGPSRDFAPLELVAWAAPAKRASAADAAAEHEALLSKRFQYDRLSFSDVTTASGLKGLRVTGSVVGNDGARYVALFAAYVVGDRYVVLGTFCKPDALGRVRGAFFDATSISVRSLAPGTAPIVIATVPKVPPPAPTVASEIVPKAPPPVPTMAAASPVATTTSRPTGGGLIPIIKTLQPPSSTLDTAEGAPVHASAKPEPPPGQAGASPGDVAAPLAGELAVAAAGGARTWTPGDTKLNPPDAGTEMPAAQAPVKQDTPEAAAPVRTQSPGMAPVPPAGAGTGGAETAGDLGPPAAASSDLTHLVRPSQVGLDKTLPPDFGPDAAAASAGVVATTAGEAGNGPGEGFPVAVPPPAPTVLGTAPGQAGELPAGPTTELTLAGDGPNAAGATDIARKPQPPDVAAAPVGRPTADEAPREPLDQPVTVAALAVSAPRPAIWTTYQSPYGFSVEAPAEWRVELRQGFIVVAPRREGEKAQVAICPVFVGDVTRDDLIPAAQKALQRWTAASQVHWEAASAQLAAQGLSVTLAAAGDEGGVPMRLAATMVTQGNAGVLTVLEDETARFDEHSATFKRIAQGFSGGSLAVPPAVGPSGTRFVDAPEGALELRLPNGWQATGGVKRYNGTLAIDVRLSGDGVACEWRQPYMPAFRDYTAFLKGLGWHEGDYYSANAKSERLLVLRSRQAEEFLQTYVLTGSGMQGAKIDSTEVSETAAELLPSAKSTGVIGRLSLGGAAPRERTYVLATGEAPAAIGNACWQAAYLSVEASPEARTSAGAALAQVVRTAALAEGWQGTAEERAALSAFLAGCRKAAAALAPQPESQLPYPLLTTEALPVDAARVMVPSGATR